MKEFYDAENHRIFCFDEEASPEFWEEHWRHEISSFRYREAPHSRVVRNTRRYLPQGSRILEGGCGLSQEVYALHHAGYRCTGVDFAEKTVAFVNSAAPDLKVFVADVRLLPFKNNAFDGYWSLGVIEHFPEGFDPIVSEIIRVLRPGGYLFLTFPAISPLCKLKARLGYYPNITKISGDLTGFYQFKFNPDTIAQHFRDLGFSVLKKHLCDATKGLKDEVAVLEPVMQKIYSNQHVCTKVLRKIFNALFSPFCGHLAFLILQKDD